MDYLFLKFYFERAVSKRISRIAIFFYVFTGAGLLVFFDDELTAFRNKNCRFNFNVEKIKWNIRVMKKIEAFT